MGSIILIFLFIGFIILITAPFIYLFFSRNGKKKVGILVSILWASLVLVPTFSILFEGKFYTKSDLDSDLKLAHLRLLDDYELIDNNVTGFPERYQYTIIKISKNDHDRIILEIKKGKNYKIYREDRILSNQIWNSNVIRNRVVYTDYFYNNQYVRESYYKNENYVMIKMIFFLEENSDRLRFNRIED